MKIIKNERFVQMANVMELELLESGVSKLDRQWHSEEVCSPYSRIYYVISGEGTIRIPAGEGELRRLRPGYMYLIPNGLYYDYFCEDALEKVHFHVNMRMQDGFDLFCGCKDCYERYVGADKVLEVRRMLTSVNPVDYAALKGELYLASAAVAREAGLEEKMNRNYSELIAALFALLPGLPLSVSIRQLADRLNVSESTLSKRFRRETGTSIGDYRRNLVLARARQLLASGKQSIGEIAEEMGFCDQFYFSRYFKENQGETPSAYRSRYIKLP